MLGVVAGLVLPALVLLHPIVLDGALLAPAEVFLEKADPGREQTPEESRAPNAPLADRFVEQFPRAATASRRIRSGDHPLWNPLVGAGAPLLAAQDLGALAPWNLLLGVVVAPERARSLVALGTLLAAALGMYLFLRAARQGPAGAVLGAAAFSLCAPLVLGAGEAGSAAAACLPWLLLTTERLLQDGRRLPRAGALALVAGLIWISGHFATAFHALLAAILYAAVRLALLAAAGRARQSAAPAAAALLGAHLAGLGLAAPYLWPAIGLLLEAGLPAANGGLAPEALATLFAPAAFGYPVRGHPPFGGPLDYASLCLYLGILPLFFLFAGSAAGAWRRRDWWLGLVLLTIGAGTASGLLCIAPLLLPKPLVAAAAARFALPVAALGAALLAGRGLEAALAARDPGSPATRWRAAAIGTAALIAAATLVACLVGLVTADPAVTFRQLAAHPRALDLAPRLLVPMAGLVLVVLALAGPARWGLGRASVAVGAIALTVLDLVWAHRDFHPTISPAGWRARMAAVSLPADWPGQAPPARMVGHGCTLPPDLAQLFGANDARCADRHAPPGYRALWAAGMVPAPEAPHLTRTIESPVLDLLAVRHVIASRPLGGAVGATVGADGAPAFLPVDLRGAPAGGVATLFTRLEGATTLPQGTRVADVVFRTTTGLDLRVELRAGENTAEGDASPLCQGHFHHWLPPALERFVPDPKGRRIQHIFAASIDLRSLAGTLEAMEIEYRAPLGRLHVERFSPGTERPSTPWSAGGRLRLTEHSSLWVYENTAALEWARIVHTSEVVEDPAARLARLVDPAFDRAAAVLLEAPFDFQTLPPVDMAPSAAVSEGSSAATDGPSWVRVIRHAGDAIELEAALAREGFLVIADAHAPGWRATVQGKSWPLLRVNHALRGVPLARGGSTAQPYRIQLEYAPSGYRAGLVLALLAGLALVFAFMQPWAAARCARRRRAAS